MDGGVELPLNIIINIFRWLPSSLSYRASYQIVAQNCAQCSVLYSSRPANGDKEDKWGVAGGFRAS